MSDAGYHHLGRQRSFNGTCHHGCADLHQLRDFLPKSITPDKVRIPVFIVVIAAFVTILQMFIKAYLPDVDKSLGLFIPLIVVNCIILGRAEAFAAKQSPVASLFDGIGIGLGFTIALTLLGMVRELLGAGSLFGFVLLPETYNTLLFVLPPGAFITLGYLIAIVNKLKNWKS